MHPSPLDQLDDLHTSYVEAVNEAVAADNLSGVRRLAAAYDAQAARLLTLVAGLDVSEVRPVEGHGFRRFVSRRHRNAA